MASIAAHVYAASGKSAMTSSQFRPRTTRGQPGERMEKVEESKKENRLGALREIAYLDEPTGLRAMNHAQHFGDLPVVRRWVTISNTSTTPLTIDLLYAAYWQTPCKN